MMWCFFHFDVKLMFLFVEMMCVRTVVVLLFEYSSSQSSYGFVENVLFALAETWSTVCGDEVSFQNAWAGTTKLQFDEMIDDLDLKWNMMHFLRTRCICAIVAATMFANLTILYYGVNFLHFKDSVLFLCFSCLISLLFVALFFFFFSRNVF